MFSEALRWWLAISAIGVLATPIALAVFRSLPGRGYAFAKPVGLLLLGFSYWLILTLGIMPNRPGTIVWAAVPLLVASALIVRRHKDELQRYAEEQAGFIAAVEVLFLVVFLVAAYLKSFVPDIGGTEKPMDFMMLNAAFRSESYPPDDAWLAGYGVSYYYFGYVIQAMIAKLAAVPTAVAFNLALAGTASLAATAAFGLGYELSRLVRGVPIKPALITGVAAVILLAVMGNLVGALEFGIANDVLSPGINDTVQINDLETQQPSNSCMLTTPAGCILKYPSDETSFWWWWRSTRISPEGNSITEFPFFSFLLGDLHPHVMAIPFVLTAFGLAVAFWSRATRLGLAIWQQDGWLLLVAALLLGGLGFLNTWDLPTFGFLLITLVLARNYAVERDIILAAKDTAGFAAPLAVLCFTLYSPFYFSFGSQASGFEAVTDGATRPLHSALFWGPLVILNLPLPFVLLSALKPRSGDIRLAAAVPALVLVFWAALTLASHGFGGLTDAITARGFNWFTYLFFAMGLAAALIAVRRLLEQDDVAEPATLGDDWQAAQAGRPGERPAAEPSSIEAAARESAPALIPVLVAMSTALLLILGAELFYVQDVFNSRLNTVFKLSYQAWLLLAVTGAYGLWWLAEHWQPARQDRAALARGAWTALAGIVVLAALLYPAGATLSRTRGLSGERTLNGLAAYEASQPSDYLAMQWLRDRAGQSERIVEGMGGQYSTAGRISAGTGVPAILGWLGHEVQWARDPDMLGIRSADVDEVYQTTSMADALQILQQYGVTYVFVGSVERQKYPPEGLDKFVAGLPVAAQYGNTFIFRVPRHAPEADAANAP